MRIAVITIVARRHRHLRRQLDGLVTGTVTPDRHVVVAIGDRGVRTVVAGRADVIDLPADHGALPLARARNGGAARATAHNADRLISST